MPKIRLENPQLYAIKGILLGTGKSLEWALNQLGIVGVLDDSSEQTLETLIFKCYECGLWRSIEESDPTAPGACIACLGHTGMFGLENDDPRLLEFYSEDDATGYF